MMDTREKGKAKGTEGKKIDSKPLTRPERVVKALSTDSTKLYCLFLSASLPVFEKANTTLQTDAPCIHIMKNVLLEQLKSLFLRFITPVAMNAYKDRMYELPFDDPIHQKDDQDLFIGEATRQYLQGNRNIDTAAFFKSVRCYYSSAAQYMVKKFPHKDPVICNAEVADVRKRENVNFESLRYFADRFSCLGMKASGQMDKLEEEFLAFQVDDLPKEVIDCPRADQQWHLIGQLKDLNMKIK